MFRKQGMRMVLGCALALGTAMPSLAADCSRKINLMPGSLGAATDSSGTAEVRARGDRQRFKVSIDSRVPDGTTYVVKANGMVAGTITVDLGMGELQLGNDNGKALPAGVGPVCSIGLVAVQNASGNVLLQGSF